jgi:hypothetical protein
VPATTGAPHQPAAGPAPAGSASGHAWRQEHRPARGAMGEAIEHGAGLEEEAENARLGPPAPAPVRTSAPWQVNARSPRRRLQSHPVQSKATEPAATQTGTGLQGRTPLPAGGISPPETHVPISDSKPSSPPPRSGAHR